MLSPTLMAGITTHTGTQLYWTGSMMSAEAQDAYQFQVDDNVLRAIVSDIKAYCLGACRLFRLTGEITIIADFHGQTLRGRGIILISSQSCISKQ